MVLKDVKSLEQHKIQHEKRLSQSKKGQILNKIYSERCKAEPKKSAPKVEKSIQKKTPKKSIKNDSNPKKEVIKKGNLDLERGLFDFRCRFCNSTFLNVSGLKSHLRWHEISTEQFECIHDDCDLIFLKELQMKRHIILDHWPKNE